jgi:3-hydroxyisobutyrate dehydrogenase-like beta-hydroxyacid dehydrogenase
VRRYRAAMQRQIALIGFGEAGATFAPAICASSAAVRAYDRKTDDPASADAKRADYARLGVTGADSAAAALSKAEAALSLVTDDQALAAAESAAPLLEAGALFFDMNSVAPETKQAAARAIEAAGGRYVDVAVMAPVDPAAHAVPLLVSGPHAEEGAALLRAISFAKVRVEAGAVGRASSIKMIRSVIVKGIEALTAECVLAAEAAGVRAEVLASLDASPPPPAWEERADYNLDRMMVHGLRRAAEMEEVVKTLETLGTGAEMSRGTVLRQRAIGARGLVDPPVGLDAKLAALRGG